ncbi:MAG: hypothetical protein A3F31_00275 [Candidatus Levybacteria bacterium RIFCSPHIGHO2_12_FULL_38_12]|nr:MAG: hypothetical protein A2770_03345 [Candidatus Levybacteria bacterium RIFCSPHIGHO2_01_FULL_38_12]OGH23196.1 MAG: hypothetical protein A3F31_00275 [Candidatus Levybacteria bacterium RIFCSPHIGHO2_12_FULL_38_12]OGH34474.1 MAG: hypothetical protein A3A47_00795 [Candidatus Levybacteria bacterium RIFCSPLOWO2_01_FULL_37_20]OGH44722.1 MAG: hypothetical protein A3J14_00155 [Candidatus Levybacteria bacterium RIFCSPLOWO2_02_FULL_37_18]
MLKRSIPWKKACAKAIPLWMVILLMAYSVMASSLIEYYILKRNFNDHIIKLAKTAKNPDELVQILKQQVLPQKGYVLGVTLSDIGSKLLESGVIDKQKYEQLFVNEKMSKDMMKYLTASSKDHMMINEGNAHFMVNTLWAFGLVNKNKILEEGSMATYGKGNPMTYASTGGWTLGQRSTREVYSSKELIKLSTKQQELVEKIAQNVFRPCCNNSTEFPDCNHGMAALGYIEIAVSQGISEKQIYKDILMLNSFWFPKQYVELAAYMNKQKIEWKHVDPKRALSAEYSSAAGSQKISLAVQNLPGFNIRGGGCST